MSKGREGGRETPAVASRGQTRRGKSADVAAARARVVELVSLGWTSDRIAKEIGRSLRWVKDARDEMKAAISAASDARVEGAIAGAAEAKRLLGEATADAARRVIARGRIAATLNDDIAIKAETLALKNDLAIFDRGGVPSKSETDVTVGLSAEKRAAIVAILGGV